MLLDTRKSCIGRKGCAESARVTCGRGDLVSRPSQLQRCRTPILKTSRAAAAAISTHLYI